MVRDSERMMQKARRHEGTRGGFASAEARSGRRGSAAAMASFLLSIFRREPKASASSPSSLRASVPSCLIIFTLALLSSFAWLCSPLFHPAAAFSEEEHMAIHLAHGDGFLSPFDERATAPPTAWCPPVYPAIVGLIYHALGERTQSAIFCVIALNLLSRALAAAALVKIGQKYFSTTAAVLAATVFIADPIFLNIAALCWDNSLALAIFLWLIAADLPIPLLGIGAGILLLTNASYAMAVGILILFRTLRHPRQLAFATALLLLTLFPWTLRNLSTFHRLFFIRDNLYTELWIGNQPGSTGWMTNSAMAVHPSVDPQNRNEILTLGEIAYADLCRTRFWTDYTSDRAEFLWRCTSRAAYLVFGRTPFTLTLALFTIAGLIIQKKPRAETQRRGESQISNFKFQIVFLSSIAPYLFTQVTDRYTLPLRCAMILFAAAAISRVIPAPWTSSMSSKPSPSETKPAAHTPRRCSATCAAGFCNKDRLDTRSAA
jgi:hypothetical protein